MVKDGSGNFTTNNDINEFLDTNKIGLDKLKNDTSNYNKLVI
jgi:hypothetical protein